MKNFIKNNYTASRMVLCAAGGWFCLKANFCLIGVDHSELCSLADQYFGDFPAHETPINVFPTRFTGSEIRDRDDELPLAHIAIAYEGPAWANIETLTLMVASSIHGAWDRSFGGGSNVASRLASTFFTKDNIHSFQNFFTCYTDTSLW